MILKTRLWHGSWHGQIIDDLYKMWSIYLSINLSIYLSIYQSINLSIYQSIYQSINLSIYLSIYQSINLSINQSIYQSINLSIYQSIYLSIKLSIYLSIYQSINLSINLSIYQIVRCLMIFFGHMLYLLVAVASTIKNGRFFRVSEAAPRGARYGRGMLRVSVGLWKVISGLTSSLYLP